ncbi:MAG: immune inhibitor A, partial [Candidatus Krumholzibacteria bacterium]|nr:immune inhibitor A [Candidatus Krumholzibacteria bacterium]
PGTWWRKNRRINSDLSIGVDLNRNFGFAWGYDDIGSSPIPSSETYRGTGPFSEPESQVIRDFVNNREFTMWLSYHSYGELLLYPWGYIAEDTPDHAVFFRLGELLTEANGYLAGNYKSGAIYAVNGDTDDWGYGEQITKDLIFAFTPELNTGAEGGFGPPDTLIAPTFAKNFEMNMRVLEYCENPYSVLGPYRPTMYAIEDPFYPVHTLSWSSNHPADQNPVQFYEVERCLDPAFVTDSAEYLSSDWVFDGFSLGSDAYKGSSGYYSGSGDHLDHSITTDRPYFVTAGSDTFRFWAKYDIEIDWDYAYVEVSEDYGANWATVEGNITTTYDPHGNNRGHGITGQTLSWVDAIFPLTQYLGQELFLRISYVT